MAFVDRLCAICSKPVLPGQDMTQAGQDVMHEMCLPSARRRLLPRLWTAPTKGPICALCGRAFGAPILTGVQDSERHQLCPTCLHLPTPPPES